MNKKDFTIEWGAKNSAANRILSCSLSEAAHKLLEFVGDKTIEALTESRSIFIKARASPFDQG